MCLMFWYREQVCILGEPIAPKSFAGHFPRGPHQAVPHSWPPFIPQSKKQPIYCPAGVQNHVVTCEILIIQISHYNLEATFTNLSKVVIYGQKCLRYFDLSFKGFKKEEGK